MVELEGEDAEKFLEKMKETEERPATEEELNLAKEISENSKHFVVDEKPTEKEKVITIPSFFIQILGRNGANYSVTTMGNQVVYLDIMIQTLQSFIIQTKREEWLEQHYKKYKEVAELLNEIRPSLMQLRFLYDRIEDKKFDNDSREKEKKDEFIRASSKIALIYPELYDYWVFLCLATNLHRYTIPAEAFKVLEHRGMRKIELDPKQKSQQAQQPTPPENTNP